ncbi:hypothetical protein AB5I41_10740 [Sphingomonas sp. MMS24-JH45]
MPAFNRSNVTLVDTGGKGVERITERGSVVAGREYQVDCIVWASGFEVGSEHHAARRVRSRLAATVCGCRSLGHGMRSLHGIHVHGFPNAFFVQPAQGANLISNVPHNLKEAGSTVALIVRDTIDRGARQVDVTAEAQERWIELLLDAPPRLIGGPDCTPGYYNNEGQDPTPAMRLAVGYPAGPSAYFRYLAKALAQRCSIRWSRIPVNTLPCRRERPTPAGTQPGLNPLVIRSYGFDRRVLNTVFDGGLQPGDLHIDNVVISWMGRFLEKPIQMNERLKAGGEEAP